MDAFNGPRIVSLFSGCGGLDLGFEQAGFKRVWANDFDEDAQRVYRLNLGEIDGRDIRDVKAEEIPDCEVILAGFPCQPFSTAGRRKGVYDSRGRLYEECLRVIGTKHPKAFLFENVKGLISTKYCDERSLIEVLFSDFSDIGYDMSCQILNASDYGVPQNRERLFIVGVAEEEHRNFLFPITEERHHLELKYALDIPQKTPNQVDWPLSPQAMAIVRHIPQGGSWKDVPTSKLPERLKRIRGNMRKYHSPNFYRRFSMEEVNGTITASAQPENCGIIHPLYDRRFTIREVARIQSFPDDFLFIDETPKDVVAMYKLIGNAVPPKLAHSIANAMMEQLFAQ